MVQIRAVGWLQAAVLPLALVGCASSSDDRTAENAENVGKSQQQIVGALSKKFSISLPRGVALSDEAVSAGRNLATTDSVGCSTQGPIYMGCTTEVAAYNECKGKSG